MIYKIKKGKRDVSLGWRRPSFNKFPKFIFKMPTFKQYIRCQSGKLYNDGHNILCGFKDYTGLFQKSSRFISWELNSEKWELDFYLVFYDGKTNKHNPNGKHYRKMATIPLSGVLVMEVRADFTRAGVTLTVIYSESGKSSVSRVKQYMKYTPYKGRLKQVMYPSLNRPAPQDWLYNLYCKLLKK